MNGRERKLRRDQVLGFGDWLDADVNSLKMQETEHGWGEGEESILDM